MYKKLIAVATGEIKHTFNGLCPDPIEGFDSRDPVCPACKILIEAEARVAELEAERAGAGRSGGGLRHRPAIHCMGGRGLYGLRPCRKTSNRGDGRPAAPSEDSTHEG